MTAPQPAKTEPIRAIETKSGTRYRVVLDVAHEGARRQQVTKTFDVLGRKSRPEVGSARWWVNEARDQLARGTYAAPTSQTVGDLLDKWLVSREADVLSGAIRRVTLDGYRSAASTVRCHLGQRRVTALRHSDVEGFKAWALREGAQHTKVAGGPLGNDAVSQALGVLTKALDLAVLDGHLMSNPAARVKRPSRRKTDDATAKAYWTPAQFAAFRTTADNEPLVLAVALRLALCGLRRSEACGLTWGAVDLADGSVLVTQGRVVLRDGTTQVGRPKSTASRRLVAVEVLQPGTTALLRQLKAEQNARRLANGGDLNDAGLVLTYDNGSPLRPERVSEAFQRVAGAAGLPRITLHATRHSIASDLAADAELSDIDAAALLGHTVAVFHSTYAQRSQAGAKRAAERWAARRAAEAVGSSQ